MKNYTDLEQSKILAEILPIETADMFYADLFVDNKHKYIVHLLESYGFKTFKDANERTSRRLNFIPCWSFSALFDILPDSTDIVKNKADTENEKYMCTVGIKDDIISTFGKNPVDACVEMIEKLHELKIL